jgi:uncharacterized membrane protein
METQLKSPDLSQRIQSVDFVRGLVMVLMAIDHVRVYSGLPPGGADAGIFFTRWVTHFCAPAFVFLTGTSAFLYGTKLNNPSKLALYLFTRGLLLIVLELTIIRFFWTFNFSYSKFTLAGVIWMLGCCMILLSLMVKLKPKTIGFFGIGIIFLQNLFALIPKLLPTSMQIPFGRFWEFIYPSGLQGPAGITILYVIVPWIGVMAAGYGFGVFLQTKAVKRKRILIRIGATAIFAFIFFGSLLLMRTSQENTSPFLIRLLNQNKYPASPLFLLMTLGPCILLMAFVKNAKRIFSKAIVTFGRVPLFYYLIHIPLIHVSALLVQFITKGQIFSEGYDTAPYAWLPDEYRWSLGLLYFVFIVDVVILYFACRWYEKYKFNHPEKQWLKFI